MAFRLIDTTTHKLKTFDSVPIPEYAILSHTWSHGNEISYQEMIAIRLQPDNPAKQLIRCFGGIKMLKSALPTSKIYLRDVISTNSCLGASGLLAVGAFRNSSHLEMWYSTIEPGKLWAVNWK